MYFYLEVNLKHLNTGDLEILLRLQIKVVGKGGVGGVDQSSKRRYFNNVNTSRLTPRPIFGYV